MNGVEMLCLVKIKVGGFINRYFISGSVHSIRTIHLGTDHKYLQQVY